jgi:hypothetical protein
MTSSIAAMPWAVLIQPIMPGTRPRAPEGRAVEERPAATCPAGRDVIGEAVRLAPRATSAGPGAYACAGCLDPEILSPDLDRALDHPNQVGVHAPAADHATAC